MALCSNELDETHNGVSLYCWRNIVCLYNGCIINLHKYDIVWYVYDSYDQPNPRYTKLTQ